MTPPDTRSVVEQFLKYTEEQDFDGHRAILAEDCVFIYPYAAEGAPERIEGRDAIIERALIGGWKTRKSMKVVGFKYDALADPEWALIQWSNTSTTDEGKPYDQQYVNVIRVVDGKMKEFIEYYNPLRELAAGNPRART
ncbi:nuclear transport factor 2 family protein [Eilatimonas milleporae]|uniref:Ketosteroid isomerase-like protein n=1 Tax=Eilatimonas milleporae TaxID=911205 RepID=A0A3M0CFQ9_9PROT|nr:nuclear transport factor 2 family protein [Eilatimonas milleporae]RMB02003.1 ketosteroid isomerase-like protein [Eilatimonas milleporae]